MITVFWGMKIWICLTLRFVKSIIIMIWITQLMWGDNLGNVRHRKLSILEEKKNQTCPFSERSIKLVFILTRNKIWKIKELREIFWSVDPDVNNIAEFPNRSYVIRLVNRSSVGVGNRLRDEQQRKRCWILEKQQKPLLSSKGRDRLWDSLNFIFKVNRGFCHRWWNSRGTAWSLPINE